MVSGGTSNSEISELNFSRSVSINFLRASTCASTCLDKWL